MCNGPEYVKDKFAGGGGGVDFFLEARKLDFLLAKHPHRFKQFYQRSAEAVEPDDGEDVAGAG
ncbi:hypothetical protein PY650_29095 [Rhizobium calliandrae]|uniref:Uncharacterized protein n=1 Tax=Rhizobium calliandrae TaxID=1312182 RepID=A0ABT7KLV8_9HYPH|nr:hypothetical protein [Rhizobium calliandrae]MDL2409614.1 hypothetical protein [Rhizobium calliandrae]